MSIIVIALPCYLAYQVVVNTALKALPVIPVHPAVSDFAVLVVVVLMVYQAQLAL